MKLNNLFIVLFVIVLFISSCSAQQPNSDTATGSVAQSSSSGDIKEFNLVARQFEFEPGIITVNKGDTVRIHLTTEDVAHSFSLPDFGVNQKVTSDGPVTFEFVADKIGTFQFSCKVWCGEGHMDMKGTLIVK